ncbi:hypothetical protein LguiB_015260 [Lonicera macranthoides]
MLFAATSSFLKEDQSLIKGGEGVEFAPKRLVHRIVSLDDVKLVKNAMNTTINDVILGVTQAGHSRYLNRRYGENEKDGGDTKKRSNLPQHIRLRAALLVNIRPSTGIEDIAEAMEKESKVKWGNCKINGVKDRDGEGDKSFLGTIESSDSAYAILIGLTIHWQSYGSKMSIVVAVDEDVIPNPHQLCNDIEDSLQLIKDASINKLGLVQNVV